VLIDICLLWFFR